MSMALIFAAKEKYEVDANQELLAMVSWKWSAEIDYNFRQVFGL